MTTTFAVVGSLIVLLLAYCMLRPAIFAGDIVYINTTPHEIARVRIKEFETHLTVHTLAEGEHSINRLPIWLRGPIPQTFRIVWCDSDERCDRSFTVDLPASAQNTRTGMLLIRRLSKDEWDIIHKPQFDLEEILTYQKTSQRGRTQGQ